MSGLKKIAHLKVEIQSKTAKMAGLNGLAERYSLQAEITDMAELAIMIRDR
jgi:hypothetical protein